MFCKEKTFELIYLCDIWLNFARLMKCETIFKKTMFT